MPILGMGKHTQPRELFKWAQSFICKFQLGVFDLLGFIENFFSLGYFPLNRNTGNGSLIHDFTKFQSKVLENLQKKTPKLITKRSKQNKSNHQLSKTKNRYFGNRFPFPISEIGDFSLCAAWMREPRNLNFWKVEIYFKKVFAPSPVQSAKLPKIYEKVLKEIKKCIFLHFSYL